MGGGAAYDRQLSIVLAHERHDGSARLLEALLDLRSGGAPPDVTAAAEGLLRRHAPWSLDVDSLTRPLLEAAGGPRDQRLFLASSLNPDAPTFVELGKRESIPSRQAQKLVRRAEQRVRCALRRAPAPLPWLVLTLVDRLGGVVPAGQVKDELDRLGIRKAPAAPLLAWLAGPYFPVAGRPGWVATGPKDALSRTAGALVEDGGTRRLVDLEAELAGLRISADRFVPWLNANGAVVVHDVAVSVGGAVGVVAERLLDAHGAPRTPDQLLADLASGGRALDGRALAGALRERRRFRCSPSGEVGLATWPGEDARKAAGGKRRPSPAGPANAPAEEVVPTERFWLWVRVDTEVTKGSEAPVPTGLVQALGLAALSRRTFSSRYGPVTLANEPPQATRGPLRAVVLAAGARPEDTVLLGFSRSGDLEVEVRRGPAQPGPSEAFTEQAAHFQSTASGGAR